MSNDAEQPAEQSAKPATLRRVLRAYGWRAYALPVLIVLTVLALVNTADMGSTQNGTNLGAPDGAVAVEDSLKKINVNIPSAELPDGGDYTQAGEGKWHVIPLAPGQGDKVGAGSKLYTYTVEVEDGIDAASYAGDDGFARTVEGTLSDPRSWTGGGKVSLQRVDASFPNPTFRVSLTSPGTAHRPNLCGFQIQYEASCRRKDGDIDRVVINLARWVRGAIAFGPDMGSYRQYAINHEVGHALGNGHVGCAENNAAAPVMMQQTFGVANNYVALLNQAEPANSMAVPADNKTCKTNAWPHP